MSRLAAPTAGDAAAPAEWKAVSCSDRGSALRFLDLLKASYNPKPSGFQIKEALPLDTGAVLGFISPKGVRFQDANDRSDVLVPLRVLQRDLRARRGRYYLAMVHLGHIYGQPYPQYSSLKCREKDGALRVDVAAWYSVTFTKDQDSVQVRGIHYLQIEDH